MPDPIIPGIPDARAREIAQILTSRRRLLYPTLGYEESYLTFLAGLTNRNGYSTSAGRALWERIKNDV